VNSDWYRGALRFKELVESQTGGKYRIRIYPHSQLAGGVQRTELEMVQSGVIDLSLESSILLSIIEKRMSVLSLPWLFPDYRTAHAALASLNGPAARMGCVGDLVHVLSWAVMSDEDARKYAPTIVALDEKNAIVEKESRA